MTPSQTVEQIITNRLQWTIVDSEGRTVKKPEGANELTLLLSCFKSGITIVAGEPGAPHPLQEELDAAHAEIDSLKEQLAHVCDTL